MIVKLGSCVMADPFSHNKPYPIKQHHKTWLSATPIMSLDVSPVILIYRTNKEPTGAVVTVSGRPSQTNEGKWLLADGTLYIECEG